MTLTRVCGVFLLLINPFIKGMWFVLNEGQMPCQQPCGQLSWLRGRCMWLLWSPDLDCVVMHQLHFPVLLTIMVLEEISQNIHPCLKTTMGIAQAGA